VSYHAQAGAVHFLSAVQCHMVPTTGGGSRSTDSTLTSEPLTPTANNSGGGSVTPNHDERQLEGSVQSHRHQPSWVSTPDLRLAPDDLEPHDADDYGSVSDLYGSLLKGIDADLDSEVLLANHPGPPLTTRSVVLRRPRSHHPAANRVINRLSNVISKGQSDFRARLRQLPHRPIPKDFRRQASSNDENSVAAVTVAADENEDVADEIHEEARESPSHGESAAPPVLPESVSMSSDHPAEAESSTFQRGSAANASYRRPLVPACPSMVTSNLVHVQSGKSLIVVSGGTGYRCWNAEAATDSRSPSVLDDSCLLLWKC